MTAKRKKLKRAIGKTKLCRSGFACLESNTDNPNCTANYAFGESFMFVNSPSDVNCPYRMRFGDGSICDCPTHFALQAQLPIANEPAVGCGEGLLQPMLSVEIGTDEPRTLDEAVELLLDALSQDEQAILADMGIDEISEATIGLDAQVRKSFGLEAGNRALYRSCSDAAGYEVVHPGDAAAEILAGLVRRLAARRAAR